MKILVVDDNEASCYGLCELLVAAGHKVFIRWNGRQACNDFAVLLPDLVLLDVDMPVMNGYETARCLREIDVMRNDWIPIIFISAAGDEQAVVQGLDAGGDDYLIKPVSRNVLFAKIRVMQRLTSMRKRLAQANRKLAQLAMQDGLTGVANRRHFDEYLMTEWQRHLRYQRPLGLLLIDIDEFKIYNDFFGHQRGDECLKTVAQLLKRRFQRGTDLVARYGGEEFAIVLPETDREAVLYIANKICEDVRAAQIEHSTAALTPFLTVSVGAVSAVPNESAIPRQLLEQCDRALYQAKARGRNRVVGG